MTWEEGTWAAWLYDLLQPQVQHIVVCNPRRNALLKEGSKSDKVDAHKLADLLRTGMLRPVYHGENGLRTLRELGRLHHQLPALIQDGDHNGFLVHVHSDIFDVVTHLSCLLGGEVFVLTLIFPLKVKMPFSRSTCLCPSAVPSHPFTSAVTP